MKNKVFKNYKDIDLSSKKGQKMFVGALSAFMSMPHKAQEVLAGITNLTVNADFADEIREVIEKIRLGASDIDIGYTRFFDVRDLNELSAPGFQIRTVQSGLMFTKRPEGGRVHVYHVSGESQFVDFVTFGGALDFDAAWFQTQNWWDVEDTAAEFRFDYYRDKATIYYTMIGAIGAGNNQAYDATGSTQLEKDINTINNAAAALVARLIAAGYPVTPTTPLVLLSPIELMGRAKRMVLSTEHYPVVGNVTLNTLDYPIELVVSGDVFNAGAACTDKWYIGAPGLKSKIGEKMALTVFGEFRPESFSHLFAGWGMHGGYLNETQVTRCASA